MKQIIKNIEVTKEFKKTANGAKNVTPGVPKDIYNKSVKPQKILSAKDIVSKMVPAETNIEDTILGLSSGRNSFPASNAKVAFAMYLHGQNNLEAPLNKDKEEMLKLYSDLCAKEDVGVKESIDDGKIKDIIAIINKPSALKNKKGKSILIKDAFKAWLVESKFLTNEKTDAMDDKIMAFFLVSTAKCIPFVPNEVIPEGERKKLLAILSTDGENLEKMAGMIEFGSVIASEINVLAGKSPFIVPLKDDYGRNLQPDMSSPEHLRSFVSLFLKQFGESKFKILDLSDHGGGPFGTLFNDLNGNYMQVDAMAEAIKNGIEDYETETGKKDTKIDLVIMNQCLEATLPTYYALSMTERVNAMLGSAESIYGFPTPQIIKFISEQDTPDLRAKLNPKDPKSKTVADKIIELCLKNASNNMGMKMAPAATILDCDPKKAKKLADNFREINKAKRMLRKEKFPKTLLANLHECDESIQGMGREIKITKEPNYNQNSATDNLYSDSSLPLKPMGALLGTYINSPFLKDYLGKPSEEALKSLKEAIISNSASTGFMAIDYSDCDNLGITDYVPDKVIKLSIYGLINGWANATMQLQTIISTDLYDKIKDAQKSGNLGDSEGIKVKYGFIDMVISKDMIEKLLKSTDNIDLNSRKIGRLIVEQLALVPMINQVVNVLSQE